MTYITVPILVGDPFALPGGAPRGGRELSCSTAQRTGRAEPETSSLGTVRSITSTASEPAPETPSSIAAAAWEKLQQLPYTDPRRAYDILVGEFVEFLENSDKKTFHVRGYDTKKGKMIHVPMECLNRWSPSRRKELSVKLDRLEWWFGQQIDRPVTMITLTSYQTGLTIAQVWHNLNEAREKLLKIVGKYYHNPDYFWVPEPHLKNDSGYPHYHLAVFADVSNNVKDTQGRGMEDKLRDLWSEKYKTGSHTYGLEFSQKNGDKKIKKLKDYLVKYLRKMFLMDTWSIGMLLFNAHLWAGGYRAYGASKNISHIMKDPEPFNNTVVWLKTEMESGDYDKPYVVYSREYIPGWIDSPLWSEGIEPDNSLKIYDCWGRSHAGIVRKSYCVEAFKKNGRARRVRKVLLEKRDAGWGKLYRYGIAVDGYDSPGGRT